MNYINVLSDDDLYTLCELISAKTIKDIYKKNTKWFGTVKPGFRPTGISDNEAMALIIKNRYELIIRVHLDTIVDGWISLIDSKIKQKTSEGLDEEHALGQVLSESRFSDNIDLYFKLKKESVDEAFIQKIQSFGVKGAGVSVSKEDNSSDENKVTNSENSISEEYLLLKAELEESLQIQKSMNDELSSELDSLKRNNEELKQQLHDSEEKTKALELINQKYKGELKEYAARMEYDDSEVVKTATITDLDHISLCEVTEYDNWGQKFLLRLADIDRQGRIEPFEPDMNLPLEFNNRNKLYYLDGTSEPGVVAVWNWSAVPKANDPAKDYLKRSYNSLISPIEVIIYKECDTLEKLLKLLKEGITDPITTDRVLFAAYHSKGICSGLLCKRSDLDESGGLISINERVINLPVYGFTFGDTVRLANEKYYFRKINIGVPSYIKRVKSPVDIVRTILQTRSTWPLFKEKGKTRSEWKNVRDFLEGLEKETLLDTIADQAHCTHDEACKMFDEFMDYAESYIDGTSIEDEIIAAVISVNEDLKNKCKELLTQEWEEENKEVTEDAEKYLKDLQDKITLEESKLTRQIEEGERKIEEQQREAKEKLEKISKQYEHLLAENEHLQASIESKEKLASDVETSVAERISKAQADVAEFIASMAFVYPNLQMQPNADIKESKSETSEVIELQVPNTEKISYYPGTKLNSEDLEESKDWRSTLDIISLELEDAGIDPNYTRSMAAYLYASYRAGVPVFLIGPNGKEIANAFCVALFGKKAGVLECINSYSVKTVEECLLSDDNIIAISNPFSPSWISSIPAIIGNRTKYFFILYPFEEDIQIEPNSLFSYMLPLLTSLVVANDPVNNPVGGLMAKNFKEYKMLQSNKYHEKVLTTLRTPKILKNRISYILGNMHSMLGDNNPDYDVLYSILPYAYATMQMPTFMSSISESEKALKISNDLMKNISGLFGEFE